MEQSQQSEKEIYRVIVLRQSGPELLLARNESGFCLPEVEVPRWQRVAEDLNAAMTNTWGEEVVCLFAIDAGFPLDGEHVVHYQVAEHWRCSGKSAVPTQWVSVGALHQDVSVDASDYAAIQRSIAECDDWARKPVAGPFAQLGWFKELCNWISEVTAPRGFHLNGNFRQLNASPSFCLIRFETDGPAVWFKAVGHPNQREFSITLTLRNLFPGSLPVVLAARSDWHGWLTKESEGSPLDAFADVSLWRRSAAALGKLQSGSVELVDQLLSAGCRDLRPSVLLQLVDPFMEMIAELMKEQRKIPPMPLNTRDILALAGQIKDAITALLELQIPDALGHLDLNPGNVLTSAKQCVFLDWADAYVGPPFLTLEYLRAHARRAGHNRAPLEPVLVRSYAEQWSARLAPETILKAFELAPLVAVFAYASGTELWRDTARIMETRTAGYFRSLARRMYSEAKVLAEKASAVPS